MQAYLAEEPLLEPSPIRIMDLGNNYFRHINPRKKKTMLQIMDAYVENLNAEDRQAFEKTLPIYFDNRFQGQDIDAIEDLDLDESILWHLYSLMIFDRISSHYARYEYLDHFKHIEYFNSRPLEKINKLKYVFTSHPT